MQHFATKLTKYEERVKKHQKKVKEERLERSESAHSLKVKREMVKSFRDKTLVDQQESAFQTYLDE